MALGGSLCITQQLKQGLTELNCSAAVFCAIAGFPPSRLSQAFSEIKSLGGGEETMLKGLLDEMQALQDDVSAIGLGNQIRIAWTKSISDVLEARRNQARRKERAQQE